MMSEVTRNVILDLLPLYLADEVSVDTRTLVEKYLESDPELLAIVEKSAAAKLPEDIPIPLKKEDQMEAYLQAKKYMMRRTLIWASLIALALFGIFGTALVAFLTLVRHMGI
jgi:hypothetical protein